MTMTFELIFKQKEEQEEQVQTTKNNSKDLTKRFFGTVCLKWCLGTDESATQATFSRGYENKNIRD